MLSIIRIFFKKIKNGANEYLFLLQPLLFEYQFSQYQLMSYKHTVVTETNICSPKKKK